MLKKNVHIAILVCTAQRPKMLVKCLKSLSKQTISGQCELTIIVIENDAIQPTKPIVDSLKVSIFEPKNIDLIYDFEAKRGIPFARNKALDLCRKVTPDYVLMIDDDETAAPDWAEAHLRAAQELQGDVFQGHVEYEYEIALPVWFKPPQNKKQHGQILKRAATNNVMLSFRFIDPEGHNLSFDNHFTQGHEDTEFFERIKKRGGKIVFNQKAITTEFVTASRLQFSRHIERMFQHAVTVTYEQIYKRGWWYAFFRQITTLKHYSRFLRGVLALLLVPLVFPFSKVQTQKVTYYAVKRLSKVFGAFYGLTGRQVKYWDTVDGH